MSKLTAVQIRQAKPQDKPYKLPDGQGLYFMSPSLEKAHGVTVSEWTAAFWGNIPT
ncbi:MAG: hypothetical protein ACTFAL_05925 [Candidatus Electronema sp. V4]|uniref:hypothetical protein n=1 Tax=Candidatus Electronema sp. V4 TaxID=3454756 RepID=UPI004055786D